MLHNNDKKILHLFFSHTVGKNVNAMLMQCASFSNHSWASSTAAKLKISISMKKQLCLQAFLCVLQIKIVKTNKAAFFVAA